MFFYFAFFVIIEKQSSCAFYFKKLNLLYDPRNMANDKKIDKILVHCHWIMKDGVPHFRHHMLGGTHKEQLDCVYRFLS